MSAKQYMVGTCERYTPEQEQRLLNEQGAKGWQLLAVVQKGPATWMYFCRPVDSYPEGIGPGSFSSCEEKRPTAEEAWRMLTQKEDS